MTTINHTKTDKSFYLFDNPYILLILAVLFWSSNHILGRAIRTEVPPIGLTFWRWFAAFLLLVSFARPYLKADMPKILQHWKILLFFSGLGMVAFNSLLFVGLQSTTAINSLLMQTIMPLMIMAMSYLLFRDTVSVSQAVGITIALCGAVFIITHGSLQALATLSFNRGDMLIFTAVICNAAYSSFLRLRPAIHPLSFLATTFAFGSLLLLPFYILENLNGQIMQLNLVTLLSVSYVAIFPSITAYFCFNRGVELLGASRAGMFLYLMPIFGSLMAMQFLGEIFQPFHAIGMSLILIGILLVTKAPHEKS